MPISSILKTYSNRDIKSTIHQQPYKNLQNHTTECEKNFQGVRAPPDFAISLYPNHDFVPLKIFHIFYQRKKTSHALPINKDNNAEGGIPSR